MLARAVHRLLAIGGKKRGRPGGLSPVTPVVPVEAPVVAPAAPVPVVPLEDEPEDQCDPEAPDVPEEEPVALDPLPGQVEAPAAPRRPSTIERERAERAERAEMEAAARKIREAERAEREAAARKIQAKFREAFPRSSEEDDDAEHGAESPEAPTDAAALLGHWVSPGGDDWHVWDARLARLRLGTEAHQGILVRVGNVFQGELVGKCGGWDESCAKARVWSQDAGLAVQFLEHGVWSEKVVARPKPWQMDGAAKYLRHHSLWAALESRDTVLIRGSWLVRHVHDGGGSLPRRQELPDAAKWDPHELQERVEVRGDVRVVAVSHCWASQEHPDPDGVSLQTLAKAIKQCLEVALHKSLAMWGDLAVFIDWCSLHQSPRSPAEAAAFERALCKVPLWFAHRATESWLLTATPHGEVGYRERGWPVLERSVSSMVKSNDSLLDLGKLKASSQTWEHTWQSCQTNRVPPILPATFAVIVGKKRFGDRADRHIVQKLYVSTFKEILSSTKSLNFTGQRWGDPEMQQLAAALPNCKHLETLHLMGNRMKERGAAALSAALPDCSQLRVLEFSFNPLGDSGMVALAASLRHCHTLQKILLERASIGDHGTEVFASHLPGCASLQALHLEANYIGDVGATALARAADRCARLSYLDLERNRVGSAGTRDLVRWKDQAPKVRVLFL